jgi:hypothetical protein
VAVLRWDEKRPRSPGFGVLDLGVDSWVWTPMMSQQDVQRNPGAEDRGETECRFGGVCRVKVVGLSVPGSQPVTLGLRGFSGAAIPIQPQIGWMKSLRLETCQPAVPFLRGLGAYSEAINIQSAAWSISSSSREFSAMRSALD